MLSAGNYIQIKTSRTTPDKCTYMQDSEVKNKYENTSAPAQKGYVQE